ncbi:MULTISPECIES: hypothetical protein [Bacteroidales]|uniref:Uncharacterized protein n=3 Tax=Bacteroidales TaxID=171549 RepID=A0A6A1JIS3_9BACE|nr:MULTISPECIES: hypothetical protein [Bacteroidales]KAB3832029.1 hypothetical protein GAS47_23980 [Phocaeicola vulgatus]KAA5472730.1 hypothetical protein F2Y27_22230 [Bacteroides caccae]KAA5482394.1 hypothetical protein F2Y25_22250 [Bacteroides caccae]KAA5485281.1 hypothetical protein F2Y35_22160 [Bacteroides caccae]KAA5504798.1 hypothetical protein F2Y47_08330 [Bacteroides caccae]
MFRSKRKEPIGDVLKLFKIISPKDLDLYNPNTIKNVINLSLNSFFYDDIFNYVELNYGSKKYKSLTTFFDKINESSDNIEIVDLIISNNADSNIILYSNDLLNQIQKENFGIVELNICSAFNNINKDTTNAFIDELIKIFPIDYGYIFPFEKGMDIHTEKIVKKSFWCSHISVTKEDILKRNRLLNLNNGFFPKLYPINILNQSQFDSLKKSNTSVREVIDMKNNLKLVIVDNNSE